MSTNTADLKRYALSKGADYQEHPWMRQIKITFTSAEAIAVDKQDQYYDAINKLLPEKNQAKNARGGARIVIDTAKSDHEMAVRITGTKNLALTKDNGTIEIHNLSYETIALIQSLKLYRVTIEAGYRDNGGLFKIFTGEVTYISQKIQSKRDWTVYITFASEMIARWSQNRINFSVRSGVNLYGLFNYLMSDGSMIPKATLSEELKKITLDNIYNEYNTRSTIIENALSTTDGAWLTSASSLDNTVVNITTLGEKRVIIVDPNIVNIANGNPTVTSQGLNISLFPVINLFPGDILKIENSLLDVSSGTETVAGVQNTFNTNYMDPNGCYIIKELKYTLENRGNNFLFNIQAQSVNIFKGLTGTNYGG